MGPVMSGSQLVSHEVESPTSGLAQVGVVQMETHTFRETQEVYGVSASTLQRLFEFAHDWQSKRAWLKTKKAPRT